MRFTVQRCSASWCLSLVARTVVSVGPPLTPPDLWVAGGGLQLMAVNFPAETSSSSRCFHQRIPCNLRNRGLSRSAFLCQSKAAVLKPKAKGKRSAGATKYSVDHTQTLQTPHNSAAPAHPSRTYRDEGSLSELAIADYLSKERRRTGTPEVQTKPSNAQPTGGAAALAAEYRRQRYCYSVPKAEFQHTEQSPNSNFLERRPKVQVPATLQGCVTEVVPQSPPKKLTTSLDGDAQLALWYLFDAGEKAMAEVEAVRSTLGRVPSHDHAAAAAGLPSAAALKQCLDDGQSAKLQLMAANIGMVNKLATGYNHNNVSFQELVQAGLSGLETGLTRFDPSRGAKLSTAMFFYIRDSIFKTYRKRIHVVQIPVTTQEQMYRFEACVRRYQKQHPGKQPSDEYIMKATKLSRLALERVWELKSRTVLSIDAPSMSSAGGQDDGNSEALLELISTAHEDENEVLHLQLDMLRILDSLPGSMGIILREKYGLSDGQDKTFEEVSVMLGMRKWKVQEMHHAAIKSLKDSNEVLQLASAL